MQRIDKNTRTITKRIMPRTPKKVWDFMRGEKSLLVSRYKQPIDIHTIPETQVTIQSTKENVSDYIPEHKTKLIELSDQLKVNMTQEEAIKIFNRIMRVMLDQEMVMSLLQELDQKLGERLAHKNIHFTPEELPEYLIVGMAYHIPGPPSSRYVFRHKEKILDKLLLEYEQSYGINMEGVAPKFIGIVDPDVSNKFVAEGHVFTEEKQITRILFHGNHSHRLQLHALWNAMKKGLLDLSYGDQEKKLTPKQLLDFFVHVQVINNNDYNQVWNVLLDNISGELFHRLYKPSRFTYSCRSPDSFNSLLLCFGAEFQLPNLQHYLLDSHWKASNRMIERARSKLLQDSKFHLTNDRLYVYCMEAQENSAIAPSYAGTFTHFSFTEEEAMLRKKRDVNYEAFDAKYPANIVKKKQQDTHLFNNNF